MADGGGSAPAAGSGLEWLDGPLVDGMRDTGATTGAVYLLPPGEETLYLAVLSGLSQEIAVPWSRVELGASTPVSDALRGNRLVWLGSQEEVARRYPRIALVLPYPFTMAAAPIATDTTVWGGLVMLWPGAHTPRLSAHERDAVDHTRSRLGLRLLRAEEAGHPVLPGSEPRVLPPSRTMPHRPDLERAAIDFAERLPDGSCALDLDGRVTFVTATGAELLGAEVAELLGTLPWETLPWLDDPLVEEHYRSAVVTHQPTSFTVLRPPDRWLSFQLHPDTTGISVRIAPTDPEPAEDEAGGRRPEVSAVPSRAGVLAHLTHLAATLAEAVGVRDVVDGVADQILPAFEAQGLILFVAEDDRLRILGSRGYSAEAAERLDGLRLSASPSPAAQVLSDGVPRFIPAPEEMERLFPGGPALPGTASWAFLPLIASGRPVGSLVLSYDRPRPFPPTQRAVLVSVAGLVAQALDRARLHDTRQELAHHLQTGLLPRTLPRVPGLDVAARYQPAGPGMDIGGDFYDLIRLDDTAVAAAIGDVQGHSVTAAALMGQVRTAVHATAGAPPGEVLASTNRLLTDLDPGLFTSCLYVRVDLERRRICLASAGHPPPLLRHPDGRTETLDVPPGLLLGIDPSAEYEAAEFPLPAGATLALYTDGLVETPGVDIEDATAELAGHLARAGDRPVEELADTLVDRARESAPSIDDIALLLLRPGPADG
ncbi:MULTISPECIES: SpoIIE family protein phosphatase [unclassified Streptomyces]|uniref:SpoIIE family protein phosphatase n=1 Tax=unclassified Streptomyces TaxID=2593676 RepID=UPI0022B727CA|nr:MULTISPECIES: SpoIIE family protein phosphatase [unclassified Streptomyces]MCZ7414974.1 SpoIIE family protein phosphatase [Streptomyces sp. WMMC897]MCZ7431917.1 SpoIIE family protein phosphatase [Streptomyces sp. WMMC1477]